MKFTLYHYWRSSSSWRVRWGLELKNTKYESVHVDLLNGESESPAHLKRNPLGYVPVLNIDGQNLIESVSILEWLEERNPTPPLFPKDSFLKAHARTLVEIINADTQPVQNLTTLDKYSDDPEKRKEWMKFFISRGLAAYEKLIQPLAGAFSIGNEISMPDLFLIPQVYNAKRNDLDMTPYPLIDKIYNRSLELDSCKNSHPEKFKPKEN